MTEDYKSRFSLSGDTYLLNHSVGRPSTNMDTVIDCLTD